MNFAVNFKAFQSKKKAFEESFQEFLMKFIRRQRNALERKILEKLSMHREIDGSFHAEILD